MVNRVVAFTSNYLVGCVLRLEVLEANLACGVAAVIRRVHCVVVGLVTPKLACQYSKLMQLPGGVASAVAT